MEPEDKEIINEIKSSLVRAKDYLDPHLLSGMKDPHARAEFEQRISDIVQQIDALYVAVDRPD